MFFGADTNPALERREITVFDVVIVGGGPAGLNAALMLGWVRRPVLVADAGSPRNSRSGSLHGFLSRDGADGTARPRRRLADPPKRRRRARNTSFGVDGTSAGHLRPAWHSLGTLGARQ